MSNKWPALVIASAALGFMSPAMSQTWPDGPGKERVVDTCGGCHDINRLRVGYTPEGWHTVEIMMQNMEAPVPKEEWPIVTAYLIKNFPERARPAGTNIAGPV